MNWRDFSHTKHEEKPKISLQFVIAFVSLLGFATFMITEYIKFRLLGDLHLGAFDALIFSIVCYIAIPSIPLAMLTTLYKKPHPLKSPLSWTGLFLMGLLSTVLVLTVCRDLVLTVIALAAPGALKGYEVFTAIWVLILSMSITAVGLMNARRIGSLTKHTVPTPGISKSCSGIVIAQLSDIHIGPTIGKRFLRKMIDATNAAKPDIIVITGDLVDGSVEELYSKASMLKELSCPRGVFVSLGNHDYYSGALEWTTFWESMGFHVLNNANKTVTVKGSKITIAGVTDRSAGRFLSSHAPCPVKALSGSPSGQPVIMLAHQPIQAIGMPSERIHLQLSGHTHAGQFFPWTWFIKFKQPITQGFSSKFGHLVYVNRGTGYWGPPKRILSNSEISLFTLVPVQERH